MPALGVGLLIPAGLFAGLARRGAAGFFVQSTTLDTSSPATTVTSIFRVFLRSRYSIVCGPADNVAVSGVLPDSTPSMKTLEPDGFDERRARPGTGAVEVGIVPLRPANHTAGAAMARAH